MAGVPMFQTVRDVTGWVYFAGAYEGDELRYIKIGYTSGANPNKRIGQVADGVPHDVRLLAAVPGCLALEHLYHEEFAKWRVCGEWFEPCGEIHCRIDTVRAMPGAWKDRYDKDGKRGRKRRSRRKVRSTVDSYVAAYAREREAWPDIYKREMGVPLKRKRPA